MDKFDLAGFPIIGLAGLRGAGKNYTADLLKTEIESHSDKQVEILSFADPMREAVKLIFGWTDEQLADRKFKESLDQFWLVSPRVAMQTLGTDWGRNMINPRLWLMVMERRIKEAQDEGRIVIVDDVRFENEADMLKEYFDTHIVEVIPDPHSPEATAKVDAGLFMGYMTRTGRHVSDNRLPEHLITQVLHNDFTEDYSTWVIDYASDLITQFERISAA